MRRVRLVFSALLALAVLPALAEIAPEIRWSDPSKVSLDVVFPGDGYHATWDLYRCDCGDLLVHSELSESANVEKGETLLVEGRAILYRGFPQHEAEYGASLDAPALMMQLAAQLLERLEPGGPSKVTGQVEREMTEREQHISLDTGTAVGTFQAPWKAAGMLAPAEDDKRRFDIRFDFSVVTGLGAQQASMRLKGKADYARAEFPVPATEPLERWNLAWRDSEDPAKEKAADLENLQQLRELLSTTN